MSPNHCVAIYLRFVAIGLMTLGCAQAQETRVDPIRIDAGVSVAKDNNFLRVPTARAAEEQITTGTLDVKTTVPYGQQRLELEANLNNSQHQTFSNFDFTGLNYNAAWRWTLSPDFSGVLSSKRTEMLNSSADTQNAQLRNKNTTRTEAIYATYKLGSSWQLLGRGTSVVSTNEQAVLGITDNQFKSYLAGLSYGKGVDNTLSYSYQVDSGSSVGDYNAYRHEIAMTWVPSGNSLVKGGVTNLTQRFAASPQFDFQGVASRIDATWRLTGKISLSGGWQRDLASAPTINSIYTQTDTWSASPRWDIGPSLSISWQIRQGVRDSLGSPTGTLINRSDRTQESILSIDWQPRKLISIRGSLTNSKRNSSDVTQDFVAQIVSLGAQLHY